MKTRWLIFLRSRLLSVLSLLLLTSTRAGSESWSQQFFFSTENKWFEKYLDKYDKYSANMPVLYLHYFSIPPFFLLHSFCTLTQTVCTSMSYSSSRFQNSSRGIMGVGKGASKAGLRSAEPRRWARLQRGSTHFTHTQEHMELHTHTQHLLPACFGRSSLNN